MCYFVQTQTSQHPYGISISFGQGVIESIDNDQQKTIIEFDTSTQ